MEITEKWLGDIGGWQAMKTARHLADSNAVVNAKAEGESVRGLVNQGGKRYAAGLAIRSKSDVENLCTCPTSRARGMICEHSLAVALVIARAAEVKINRPAMSTGLRPETGAVRRMANRQLFLFQYFIPVEVGHRDFGGRD